MIDLLRVGGVTQWMKVAGMAEAFNAPIVSHLLPEIHVHLVAAVPNGLIVEYMPWTWRLFDNPPKPENGELKVPTEAGLGLKICPRSFREIWRSLASGQFCRLQYDLQRFGFSRLEPFTA